MEHILIEPDQIKNAIKAINSIGYNISEDNFGIWDKQTFPQYQAIEIPSEIVGNNYCSALNNAKIKFIIR